MYGLHIHVLYRASCCSNSFLFFPGALPEDLLLLVLLLVAELIVAAVALLCSLTALLIEDPVFLLFSSAPLFLNK